MEGLQRCYVQQLDHTGREAGGGVGGLGLVWGGYASGLREM